MKEAAGGADGCVSVPVEALRKLRSQVIELHTKLKEAHELLAAAPRGAGGGEMKLLDDYLSLEKQLFDYFGYVEDWRRLPVDDAREYYWRLDEDERGGSSVGFADTEEELISEDGNYYVNEIYTQRHLPKWIYRGADYTMICVDTHSDGNQFLQIFDNAKERK